MKITFGLLLCGLALFGCSRSAPAPAPAPKAVAEPGVVHLSPEAQANAGLQIQPLAPGTYTPKLKLSAVIVGDPSQVAEVGARVPGRVSAIRVKLGDVVRKGQPLIDIESVDIHEATLQYLTARARFAAAKDALDRQRLLYQERVGAEVDLRRAESEFAATRAAVDEGEEHLKFLGLTTGDVRALANHTPNAEHPGTLRSPIAGRVAALNVSVGQVVTGNENALTIANTKNVWASLRVYERDLVYLSVGQAVQLQLPSVPDRLFEGKLTFLSELVDPHTRTTEARVWLANDEGLLRPGATVTALVALPAKPNSLWLPDEAVQTVEAQPSVFVAEGNGRFVARPVKASDTQGGFRQIEAGLAPGTKVVVKGAFTLRGELERANIVDEE
ncbi:MAG: efflux RND transporter periplasmic adaptor subunit [Deltaproteobacteria bacterium]|nr:efflux RND transporter periplasmic adaptor subunit [Deltaproteobacteria bacterium]